MNEVKILFRIAGAAADLKEVELLLAELGGAVVHNPRFDAVKGDKEAWWYIEVVREDQESIEPAVSELLASIAVLGDRAETVAADDRFTRELDCTVTIHTERPLIEISRVSITQLSRLRASLGFEVYDYRE